jgi:metallo-beta-lactamase family protein
MKLSFWGAAEKVTESMFMLNVDGYKILVDCGMDMDGKRSVMPKYKNRIFPFEPSEINAVLLTHAHLDHSGNIPNLYKDGFEGNVYCTLPTYYLGALLLLDSASINMRKIQVLQGSRSKKGGKFKIKDSELYLENHVRNSLEYFKPMSSQKSFKLTNSISATFIPTGHLLGACNVLIEYTKDGKTTKVLFSGDLGRKNYPLLDNPEPTPQVDYLICESTYGNRLHIDQERPEDIMHKYIYETCVKNPGKLIIPAFSVGRTQSLLYVLNKLYLEKNIAPVKIYVDSPLAIESTKVFEKLSKYLSKEAQAFKAEHDEIFDFANLEYISSQSFSKVVSNHYEPCIIISSSGMMEGGRIQYHVRNNIQNPLNTILLIGYQPEGNLGDRLIKGQKEVTVDRKKLEVRARIAKTDIFSGHGDQNDLLNWVDNQSTDKLKKLFIVHGEKDSMRTFKEILEQKGYKNVTIPATGQTFDLI